MTTPPTRPKQLAPEPQEGPQQAPHGTANESPSQSPSPQSPAPLGAYLTPRQLEVLLKDIAPSRVAVLDGMSHVEAWDIRAHLNRIFGFGRWSGDVLAADLIHDQPTETRGGKTARKVAYRVLYRLTVNAPDGTQLATYTEAAVGESTMPDFKHGDCHDMALKTAESQALKRAATNLGTQFGLSLYRDGSREDVVRMTLVGTE